MSVCIVHSLHCHNHTSSTWTRSWSLGIFNGWSQSWSPYFLNSGVGVPPKMHPCLPLI